ncbi:MAG: Cysteine desulfurase IscS [Bacteroidota bacterium]|jgi:cysteine desulfurase
MNRVYLDNAATTPLRSEVIDCMVEVMQNEYGNASSTHSFGRSAKTILETARKSIAKIMGCEARELIFTSNATEATNLILTSAVRDLGIQRIVTSRMEHHATLYTVAKLAADYSIAVDYLPANADGTVDVSGLEALLADGVPTLVTLMHVNNETGALLDIQQVGTICHAHKALFHCDTVQSVGKWALDFHALPLDFAVASAHKFHGPKGVGFAYISKQVVIKPLIVGGEQEKGLRAGTEAVHQIAGMAKALELDAAELAHDYPYIESLKNYCWEQLQLAFPGIKTNGDHTFYNILNVTLPMSEEKAAMILFNLDMKGIAVSRGSACQSGSSKPSHVLAQFVSEEDLKRPALRISFSRFNTKEDIDALLDALKGI